MKINIKTLYLFSLEIEPSETIKEVKDKIKSSQNIKAEIWLIFSNKKLDDNKEVAYYNIQENDLIYCILDLHKIPIEPSSNLFT